MMPFSLYYKFKEYEKNSNFKVFKVMKSTSKPYIAITFWIVFLMISFEDLIFIFYIWMPNTTIEGTKKKNQFKKHFYYYF